MTPRRPNALIAVVVALVVLAGLIGPAAVAAPEQAVGPSSVAAPRTKPQVTLKLAEKRIEAAENAHAVVIASAKYAGSKAFVQRKVGRKWKTIETGAVKKSGKVALVIDGTTREGKWMLRAGVDPKKGPIRFSKPITLTIKSDPLVVADDTEVLPAAVATDPVTAYDPAAGELTLPGTNATQAVSPGDTVVVPPGPGFDTGLLRTVTDVSDGPAGTVVYQTSSASFADAFDSIPADQDINLEPYETTLAGLPDWVECTNCEPTARNHTEHRYASRREHQPLVNIRQEFADLKFVRQVPVGNSTVDVVGHLNVSAVAQMDVDVDVDVSFTELPKARVVDWYAKGGIEYDAGLSATWQKSASYSGDEPKRVEIGEIERHWEGAIGPVPVWVVFTGTIFLEFEASGEIKVTVGVSSTGGLIGGLRRAEDGSPEGFFDFEPSLDVTREVGASGYARAALGVDGKVDFYSVFGPEITAGWQAEAEASAGAPDEEGQPFFSCDLSHGPYIDIALSLNDDLADMLDMEPPTIPLWHSNFPQFSIYSCPDGTNPPQIETDELPAAVVGSFYLQQMQLSDAENRAGEWSATGLPDGLSMQSNGAITGIPVKGSKGEYLVGILFVDERDRRVRTTLELEVLSAAKGTVQYTDPVEAGPVDIVRVTAEGAEPTGTGSLTVHFAKPTKSDRFPRTVFYLDLDTDNTMDYAVSVQRRDSEGVIIVDTYDADRNAYPSGLDTCFEPTWSTASKQLTVAFTSACLRLQAADADFSAVQMKVSASLDDVHGDWIPDEVDDAPDNNAWWSELWEMGPSASLGTPGDATFTDPAGDSTSTDITGIRFAPADGKEWGSFYVDFAKLDAGPNTAQVDFWLDVKNDGATDYRVIVQRKPSADNADEFAYEYQGESIVSTDAPIYQCFAIYWPRDATQIRLDYKPSCLESPAYKSGFDKTALRVDAAPALSGGAVLVDQIDYAPSAGGWFDETLDLIAR